MGDTGLTAMNVKKINRNKVYNYIYQKGAASKLQIVRELEMGLSTVSQNLKLLEEEGLVEKSGLFDSTGGRKAQAIQIVRAFKTAIGVGILKDKIHLAAIDLYGEATHRTTIPLDYVQEDAYYAQLGRYLADFIRQNHIQEESILGVSIAVQGVVSPDGQSVSYGVIMGNGAMRLSDFARYIPHPCRLEHDSKAAARLELWNHKGLKNAALLLLNPNFGGAVITGGVVQRGDHQRSGLIEHLCLDPDGPPCYCGKRGCLEAYCSANRLEAAAGMRLPAFFEALQNRPSAALERLWTEYLDRLAFAIRNLAIVLDGAVILSGELAPFFREQDVAALLERVNHISPFPLERGQLLLGTHGRYTTAIGGALTYIERFVSSV